MNIINKKIRLNLFYLENSLNFLSSQKSSISVILVFLLLINIAFADLYLNSRTGSIYLNTSGTARMQVTPGGNFVLLGLANVSIPGNLSVGGNLSVDTNVLFVDTESDRVGIGTTTPSQLLDVSGASTFGGNLAVPSHDINVGGGYPGGITLVGQGGDIGTGQFGGDILLDGDIVSVIDVEINQSFVPTKDLFSLLGNYSQRFLDLFVANIKAGNRTLNITGNVSIGEDTLFVDNTSGRVGIGTASPGYKLHVNSGTNGNVAFLESTDSSGSRLFLYDGSGYASIVNIGGDLTFETGSGGTDLVTIKSTGNVGIGTTAPTKKFSVNGTLDAVVIDPSATPNPVINTTGNNITISSEGGSVIIVLG